LNRGPGGARDRRLARPKPPRLGGLRQRVRPLWRAGLATVLAALGLAVTAQSAAAAPSSETGILRQFKFETQRLNDRMGLGVNVANGNLAYEADDLHIAGTTLDLSVSRFWNSLTTGATALGKGWTFSTGEGVDLHPLPGGNVYFHGPSGYRLLFTQIPGDGYDTPQGVDAKLIKHSDNTFELQFLNTEETYRFDTQGRLTSDTNTRSTQKITFTYNADGSLQKITDTQGRDVTFSYYTTADYPAGDPRIGRLKQMKDLAGNRTWTYVYDPSARLQCAYEPTTPNPGTTCASPATRYAYDGQGRINLITDPQGYQTQVTYDATGRIATVKRDAADANHDGGYTTSFAYGTGDGRCAAGQTSTDVTDPRANKTTYCADTSNYEVKKVFDANGHKQTLGYNSFGNVNSYTPDSGNVYSIGYDSATDRMTSVSVPGSGQWTLSYNADNPSFRPNLVTDPQGNRLKYTYDSNGMPHQICNDFWATKCVGTDPTSAFVSLSWRGSSAPAAQRGTLQSATDGLGRTTNYGVDSQGNYNSISYPKSGSGQTLISDTTFGHDAISRVTSVTYPRPGSTTTGDSITRQIHYDPIDRVTEIDYPSSAQDALCYTYDTDGNLTVREDGCDPSSGTRTNYDYEARNLLKRFRTPTADISYFYDLVGNLSRMDIQSPNVGTTSYTYNNVNLVKTITQPDGGQFTYGYNNDNQPNSIQFPNGLTETNIYTSHRLSESKVSGSSGQVSDLNYSYDLPGSGAGAPLTQLTSTIQGTTTTSNYVYNSALNRLTDATIGSDSYHYVYDLAGNLKTKTVNGTTTSYSYNNVNELTSFGSRNLSYDKAGNELSDGAGTTFSYDDRGHVSAATITGPTTIPFTYADADQSERLTKGSTEYADGVLGLTLEQSSGAPTEYVRNPDTGQPLGMYSTAGDDYYISDRMGTVDALTNAQGQVVSTYKYTPYGSLTNSPGGPTNPIRFQGQYQDTETGLYHMGARYYDPSLPRWTQGDPLNLFRDPRQANRYAFAGDDPVNHVDPSGAWGFWGECTVSEGLFVGGTALTYGGASTIETGAGAEAFAIGLELMGEAGYQYRVNCLSSYSSSPSGDYYLPGQAGPSSYYG
jgi:RHS repeat-associated protein